MSRPRSLSLAAYRVLSWNGPGQNGSAPQRPEGELLWVHVATPDRLEPVKGFCRRLMPQRPGLLLLVTSPFGSDPELWDKHDPIRSLPQDHDGDVRAFLNHWCPNMGLWVGGGLTPNLITRAADRGIPLVLLEAETDVKIPRARRWLPDIARYTLDCFDTIFATGEERARQIRRLGVPSGKVSVAAPLTVSPNPPPWPEDELIETTHALAGRPVWLAAQVQAKEFISVLTAHRQASRLLPRLMLILHVADPTEAPPLRKRLEAMDLRCVDWDAGEVIEDSTQVILSAEPEDLGLWYRVSPVTFIGGTFEPGSRGCNPHVAASLGSAVLHGPLLRHHTALFEQLDKAGAARGVDTAEDLDRGVVDLLAPDKAASMALAGWKVVTEGAQLTDQLIDIIQENLDRRRSEHAGA